MIAPRIAAVAALAAAGCGPAVGGVVGAACTSDRDCRIGLSCAPDPGGRCSAPCAADEDCGVLAVCNAEHECYSACDTDKDCTRGVPYSCITDESNKKFCDVGDRVQDDGGEDDGGEDGGGEDGGGGAGDGDSSG